VEIDSEQQPPEDADLISQVDTILHRVGQWAVTTYGVEALARNWHGGVMTYPIEKTRLWEQDWESHMAGKKWVNMDDFREAMRIGRITHARFRPRHRNK
jgi:hypothetical protein